MMTLCSRSESDKPNVALQKAVKILSESMTKERAYQKILTHLLEHFEKSEQFDHGSFGNGLPSELVSSFNTSTLFPVPSFSDQERVLEEVEKVATDLRRVYLQKRMKEVAKQIQSLEVVDENDESSELLDLRKEYSKLVSQLQATE